MLFGVLEASVWEWVTLLDSSPCEFRWNFSEELKFMNFLTLDLKWEWVESSEGGEEYIRKLIVPKTASQRRLKSQSWDITPLSAWSPLPQNYFRDQRIYSICTSRQYSLYLVLCTFLWSTIITSYHWEVLHSKA